MPKEPDDIGDDARTAGSGEVEPEGREPHPRGASPAELDMIRASVRVQTRKEPLAAPSRPPQGPRAPAAPPAAAPLSRAELDRLIDDGRTVLETDARAAHAIFERAYRRNVNDIRVLSNYGLTLVLIEKDRERGIRFCEEAVRRGPLTTELLVNLARALVVTRNKEQAVRALRRAQELAPEDPRVGAEFAALGLRRPPTFAWLPRDSFLNKWIGMLTWRLAGRDRANPLRR